MIETKLFAIQFMFIIATVLVYVAVIRPKNVKSTIIPYEEVVVKMITVHGKVVQKSKNIQKIATPTVSRYEELQYWIQNDKEVRQMYKRMRSC